MSQFRIVLRHGFDERHSAVVTSQEEHRMTKGIQTIIYPVRDLAKAKALYGMLFGVAPYMDQPYYAAFKVAGQDVGLDPNGHRAGMTGPVGYWHVDDIGGSVKALVQAGAQLQQDVKDVGGGKLIALMKDADGNIVGLVQPA
jgi:predicted enzyme related to lactoylglutathione lyase